MSLRMLSLSWCLLLTGCMTSKPPSAAVQAAEASKQSEADDFSKWSHGGFRAGYSSGTPDSKSKNRPESEPGNPKAADERWDAQWVSHMGFSKDELQQGLSSFTNGTVSGQFPSHVKIGEKQ